MIEYKIIKSDKSRGHEGKYQLQEFIKNQWQTCGIYFLKKDAVADLKRLKK